MNKVQEITTHKFKKIRGYMQNKIIRIIVIFIEIILILLKPINIDNECVKSNGIKNNQEKVIIEPRVIKAKEKD